MTWQKCLQRIWAFDQGDTIGGVDLIPFWKWAQEKADKWLKLNLEYAPSNHLLQIINGILLV